MSKATQLYPRSLIPLERFALKCRSTIIEKLLRLRLLSLNQLLLLDLKLLLLLPSWGGYYDLLLLLSTHVC